MTELIPQTGRYALIGKRAYAVRARGGRWILWSADPQSARDGFVSAAKGGYERELAPEDDLDVFLRDYRGAYRGVSVEVFPNRVGTLMLTTKDRRAVDFGFQPLERDEWTLIVKPQDAGLTYKEVRTPTSAPWRTGSTRRSTS